MLIDSIDRYLRHDDRAVQLFLGSHRPARFEPGAVLAHPDGVAVARRLAGLLRDAGWDNEPDGSPLHALACGSLIDTSLAASALGRDLLARGVATGIVVEAGPRHRLGFGVIALGRLMVPAPRETRSPDQIYLGPEAVYLEDIRVALGIDGACAYLGSGAGHLAVLLAASCRRLVATDLLPRAAAMTRLAFEMNADELSARPRSATVRPVLDRTATVVVADLAGGLRPATFDLVTANPPWVPTPVGERIVFADGGPTGCELPLRFLHSGLTLVRPGGSVVLTMLDPVMTDGRRPIVDAIDRINERSDSTGVVATMFPTPMLRRTPDFEDRLLRNQPRLRAARHVAVVATGAGPSEPEVVAEAGRRLVDLPEILVRNANW